MKYCLSGIQMKNYLVASSSPLTESVARIKCCYNAGFAAVILKSAACYKRTGTGYKRKIVYVHDGYYADAPFEREILTIDEGIELYKSSIKHCGSDMLIIPSVSASSLDPNEWLDSCQKFEKLGAKLIQLDFFYLGTLPHNKEFYDSLQILLKTLIAELNCNIMPKLNLRFVPNKICKVLKNSGISTISLLDSIREDPDDSFGLHKGTTSYFGPRQLPYTLEYLKIAKQYGFEVCAGGGISSKHDVDILQSEGADMIQVASYILNRNFESTNDLLCDNFTASELTPTLKHNPWCDYRTTSLCERCGGCAVHTLPNSCFTTK